MCIHVFMYKHTYTIYIYTYMHYIHIYASTGQAHHSKRWSLLRSPFSRTDPPSACSTLLYSTLGVVTTSVWGL